MSMVWPTLGLRMAKEQKKTEHFQAFRCLMCLEIKTGSQYIRSAYLLCK